MKKIIVLSVLAGMFFCGETAVAAEYTESEIERIQEIQKNYQELEKEKFSTAYEDYFSIVLRVNDNGEYAIGKLKPEVEKSIEKQLNYYRDLVHLEPIESNNEMTEIAHHGSIALSALDKLEHYIFYYPKPEGMTDEFWKTAQKGTEGYVVNGISVGSNLYSTTRKNVIYDPIPGYLYDTGTGNTKVGHRHSLLSMGATEFGFGYSKNSLREYNCLNVKQEEISIQGELEPEKNFAVGWPPMGLSPTNIMQNDLRWSIELYGGIIYKSESFTTKKIPFGYDSTDDVSVELTNKKTNETFIFNESSADGEFYKKAPNSMSPLKLVFKPNQTMSYKPGDVYQVKITGLTFNGQETSYEYEVKMFDINEDYNYPTGIEIIKADKTMNVGETQLLEAAVNPEGEVNKGLSWGVSNSDLASVDEKAGKLIAHKSGTVTVTAISDKAGIDGNRHTASVEIKINAVGDSFEMAKKIEVDEVVEVSEDCRFFKLDVEQPTSITFYSNSPAGGIVGKLYDENKKFIINLTNGISVGTLSNKVRYIELNGTEQKVRFSSFNRYSLNFKASINKSELNVGEKAQIQVFFGTEEIPKNVSISYENMTPDILSVDGEGKVKGKLSGMGNINVKVNDGLASFFPKESVFALPIYNDRYAFKVNEIIESHSEKKMFKLEIDKKASITFYSNSPAGGIVGKLYDENKKFIMNLINGTSVGTLSDKVCYIELNGTEQKVRFSSFNRYSVNFKASIDKTELSVGEEAQAHVAFDTEEIPENVTINYENKTPDILSVDANGKVTGKMSGMGIIEVTVNDGLSVFSPKNSTLRLSVLD